MATKKYPQVQISTIQAPIPGTDQSSLQNILVLFVIADTGTPLDRQFTLPDPTAVPASGGAYKFDNMRNALFAAAANAKQPILEIETDDSSNAAGQYVLTMVKVLQNAP